jgi:hypothetical protein
MIADDYIWMHDYDPGNRGARERAKAIANYIFPKNLYRIILDSIEREARIIRGPIK